MALSECSETALISRSVPILAKACHPEPHPPLPPENRGPLENHYQAIQDEVRKLFHTLKISA